MREMHRENTNDTDRKALRARMTRPDAALFSFPRSLPPSRFMHQRVTHLSLLLPLLLPMRPRAAAAPSSNEFLASALTCRLHTFSL